VSDTRRYPSRPVLGVGALILDAGRVLLVERGREPLAGCWSLPGGAVETGERLEDALKREVFEETGLRVSPEAIATVFERIIPNSAPDSDAPCEYHYVLIDFYCRIESGELRPGDDSRRVDWFEIDSLETLAITEGTREVIQACRAHAITQPFVTRPQGTWHALQQ